MRTTPIRNTARTGPCDGQVTLGATRADLTREARLPPQEVRREGLALVAD